LTELRNFEANAKIRFGDVVDTILELHEKTDGEHWVDLGDFGSNLITCSGTVNVDALVLALKELL